MATSPLNVKASNISSVVSSSFSGWKSKFSKSSSSGQENTPPAVHPNIQIPNSPSLFLNKKPSTTTTSPEEEEEKEKQPCVDLDLDLDSIPIPVPTESSAENDPISLQDSPSEDASVKVVVRVRPVNRREREGVRIVQKLSSDTLLSIDSRTYTFDSVIGPHSSQEDVFNLVGVPLVEDSLAGYNTSILSYGQTGSGKTYTMWGPPSAMLDCHSVNSYQGIVPRIFHLLFSEIRKKQLSSQEKQISYQCRCSFLEIYNEQINDLLNPTQRNLQIRDDARSGFHVENLTDEYVTTVEDVTQILVKGLSNRKVGATSMNSKSSRSHIVFTCILESWCKGSSAKGFSSSKTSRISLVDLAGLDRDKADGIGRHIIQEGRHVKKSLSKLGKVVNVLAQVADHSVKEPMIPYAASCLTHLLKDTLGGNSKVTFICAISPNDRHRAGTLSTLRFGEKAKLIQNKAVINEIAEDHVNGLSDQIRQLKEELLSTKVNGNNYAGNSGLYFKGQNARESLNLLRLSLNRSLILPQIDNDDSEEELDVHEDDVKELCSQLTNPQSSFEEKSEEDIKESKNSKSIIVSPSNASNDAKLENAIDLSVGGSKDEPVYSLQEELQDPIISLSPKIDNNLKKSSIIIAAASSLSVAVGKDTAESSSVSNSKNKEYIRSPCDPIRSSLQESGDKVGAIESMAASLHRGLQIIDHYQRSSSAAKRRSPLGLSFDHLTSVPNEVGAQASNEDAMSPELGNYCSPKDDNNVIANAIKSKIELETLCAEQAAMIKQLNHLVDQYKHEREQHCCGAQLQSATSLEGSTDRNLTSEEVGSEGIMSLAVVHEVVNKNQLEEEVSKGKGLMEEIQTTYTFDLREREALLEEIDYLKKQMEKYSSSHTDDVSLLDELRNGTDDSERQRWTESESRWISLTEELRVDLERNRRFAETKEFELNLEKKCTAELDDALQRSILGHARIIEHYVELQEQHNDLVVRHKKVMQGIAEVKKAAMKSGSKGQRAFAAALAVELSSLRVEREREREHLKKENKGLRIQLRDTAEAVHAAGELLVRLREAEEAVSVTENKYAHAQHENEKMRKQMEKMKRKHAMEMVTMKHYLAESRLPESALEPLYHQQHSAGDETVTTPIPSLRDNYNDNDQSWRAAFTPSYQQ